MSFDTVIGFVPADAGIMLCADCAADDIAAEDDSRGSVVFESSETDAPNHCDECGTLLAETLTDDGREYVANALREYIAAAVFTNEDGTAKHGGSASCLDDWREEFGAELDDRRVVELYDRLRERQASAPAVVLAEYDPGFGRAYGVDTDGAHWTTYDRDEGDDDCDECGARITSGWLCLDGGETVCSAHVVSTNDVRSIAAQWHSGQSSALYALASSGAVVSTAKYELRRELATAKDWRARRELRAALLYVTAKDDHPAARFVAELHEMMVRALAELPGSPARMTLLPALRDALVRYGFELPAL